MYCNRMNNLIKSTSYACLFHAHTQFQCFYSPIHSSYGTRTYVWDCTKMGRIQKNSCVSCTRWVDKGVSFCACVLLDDVLSQQIYNILHHLWPFVVLFTVRQHSNVHTQTHTHTHARMYNYRCFIWCLWTWTRWQTRSTASHNVCMLRFSITHINRSIKR